MLKDLKLYGQVVIERLGSTESAESELNSAKYGSSQRVGVNLIFFVFWAWWYEKLQVLNSFIYG